MKQYVWVLYPNAKINGKGIFTFKTKIGLCKFIKKNLKNCYSGGIKKECARNSIYSRTYYYNVRLSERGLFLVKTDVAKRHRWEKEDKLHSCFSKKIFNLCTDISRNGLTESKAKNLTKLIYKSGYKEEEGYYELGRELTSSDFFHFSDRLGGVRMKWVLDYFKSLGFNV